MITLAQQARLSMKEAPRSMITDDELYHMLNCKPMRSDGRYIENCIAQDPKEADLTGEKKC